MGNVNGKNVYVVVNGKSFIIIVKYSCKCESIPVSNVVNGKIVRIVVNVKIVYI